MKFNREYLKSDNFYATVLVTIAILAILSLLMIRDSAQLSEVSGNGPKIIHRVSGPDLPPPTPRPPEALKPTKIRLKAANKEATPQTMKEEGN